MERQVAREIEEFEEELQRWLSTIERANERIGKIKGEIARLRQESHTEPQIQLQFL